MAECFNREGNSCAYMPGCELKSVLGAATAAYLRVLDCVTLQDLIATDPDKPRKKARTSTISLVNKA